MKPLLALAAILAAAAPVLAESRSVLVVVTHDKDGKAQVTVHSDDKQDRRDTATVDEACKALAKMEGWGSSVSVYVVTDSLLARKDRKALFDAIDANSWLDLAYYGRETPKHLAEYFLKQAKQDQKKSDDKQPRSGLGGSPKPVSVKDEPPPNVIIGYTEYRADLPGGRYVNAWTRRAVVVKADGTGRRVLAEELTREKGYSTHFNGWSPDGKTAILLRNWQSEANGKWEEAHQQFSFSTDGRLADGYLFDLKSGKATNMTGVDRFSHFNEGLRFVPGDPTRLRFSANVDGKARTYVVDCDGKNKRELSKDYPHLVHGMGLSPDGKRGAYEDPAYRLFLADADGSNAKEVKTGQNFNFLPAWSPDGAWVLFLAGEHYDCHPHVIKADGTGLKKLASRNGYSGVIDFLDVYDFHGGSSDLPVWAPDSKSVFYTAKVGKNVELFRVTLDGKSEQLTETPAGSMHYHPAPSPDGNWLAYGSKRDGVRQLYVMRLSDKKEWRITDLKKGHAAMWASWQPRTAP